MNSPSTSEVAELSDKALPVVSEVLILPDGKVMAHSLTPLFVSLLSELNPDAPEYRTRREILDDTMANLECHKADIGCRMPNSKE